MTKEQMKELVSDAVRSAVELMRTAPKDGPRSSKRYIYGLRGIRDLFNVSHATAQHYKDTFLAPAVMQRGRKIVVDADKAVELYNNRNI